MICLYVKGSSLFHFIIEAANDITRRGETILKPCTFICGDCKCIIGFFPGRVDTTPFIGCPMHGPFMLYELLHDGKSSLLALHENPPAPLAEGIIAEGKREVCGHELGTPAPLALHAMRVLERLG
jgi:hypothetical protein